MSQLGFGPPADAAGTTREMRKNQQFYPCACAFRRSLVVTTRWPVHTRRCTCMGASRGFRNRADESDWSNIDVLRELRLRGAIRDVYSCMHSWARKSLVLCFAFGHLGVLFVSVASGISRRAYLIDAPRYFPSFSLRWSLTKQPHRYPSGTISIPISVLFNPLCL